MAKWICVMRQDGEGCDYSIGCGVRVVEVEATSRATAEKLAIKSCDMDETIKGESDYHLSGGESPLKKWTLYEVSKEFDLMPLLVKAQATFDEKEKETQREEELEEFERLRKKLGK